MKANRREIKGAVYIKKYVRKNVHLFNILNMLEQKNNISQMKSIIQTVYSKYYVGSFQKEIDTCAENQGENTFYNISSVNRKATSSQLLFYRDIHIHI